MTHDRTTPRLLPMAMLAIGVVYGDIGTSPLYTMKEAFGPHYGLRPTDANVLGVLSLVFWTLMLIVTLKYVMLVLRADNRGEGGIMSLTALAQRLLPVGSDARYFIGLLGIFGVALFFGDAVITPAISVLSAVEGLEVAAPQLRPFVIPVSVGVLVALFLVQRRGTERIGRWFGPITIAWFVAIAATGTAAIVDSPRVLAAIDPSHGVAFARDHGTHAFFVLGAVVLAVTGAEALYADMGHFGRRPIQLAWLWFVFPALALNYFGQGALLLDHPDAVSNPFYRLVPAWGLYPMIVLATAATVIASQAVISGAFSLARQAIQLGYLPRMAVLHTSAHTIGQVYVPWVNRLLLVVVVALVLGFGTSSALASAYGVSVTGTMAVTTVLLWVVAVRRWSWQPWLAGSVFLTFLAIDLAFFGANVVKLMDGAWFPLALGVVVFTLIRTWRRGRELVAEEVRRSMMRIEEFVKTLDVDPPHRVPGTAVVLTASNDRVPMALLHNLKLNQVLHERVILVTVDTMETPHVDLADRAVIREVGNGFWRLDLRFGFMESVDVPAVLTSGAAPELHLEPERTIYFASRETLVPTPGKGMALWRDRLYLAMARNTAGTTSFFRIPGNRLVELGTSVEI